MTTIFRRRAGALVHALTLPAIFLLGVTALAAQDAQPAPVPAGSRDATVLSSEPAPVAVGDRSGPERSLPKRYVQDGPVREPADQNPPARQRFAREGLQSQGQPGGRHAARNQPGQFDFYVLALSWSPSFCEVSRERNGGQSRLQQCAGGRPYSFVVHGLWPQYERGFPRDCQVPAPRLARSIVNTMLDIMPSPRLVFNQWDRHGTCTGLDGRAYFDLVRKARETVRIPDRFHDITNYLAVAPAEVESAFIAANPGLSPDGISVTCDHRRLSEVRICLSKDLQFRGCPEVDSRACRSGKVMMPPVRGG